MFPVVIDIKGTRYPVTVYLVYFHEQDVMKYSAHLNNSPLCASATTLHIALENLGMLIVEQDLLDK